MNHTLRIGSRKSMLALRQAKIIAAQLQARFPGLKTEILTRDTFTTIQFKNPSGNVIEEVTVVMSISYLPWPQLRQTVSSS